MILGAQVHRMRNFIGLCCIIIFITLRACSDQQFFFAKFGLSKKICRCELKHVTKSHWQISMAKDESTQLN